MIVVCKDVDQLPKTIDTQLRLFEKFVEINGFRYLCYMSTLILSRADVWSIEEELTAKIVSKNLNIIMY